LSGTSQFRTVITVAPLIRIVVRCKSVFRFSIGATPNVETTSEVIPR
jgi:hypothetical protein